MDIEEPKTNKEPWLAVSLSRLIPGLGQLYCRRYLRGFSFLFAWLISLIIGILLVWTPTGNLFAAMAFFLLSIAVSIWGLFDSYWCAIKLNSTEFELDRKAHKDPWLAVFLSTICPGIGHFYLGKWVWGIFLIVSTLLTVLVDRVLGIPTLALLWAYACYHAYISSVSPQKRSIKIIIIFAGVILISNVVTPRDIIRIFIRPYRVPTEQMTPTIRAGDLILVKSPLNYTPQRGDIIAFKYPENPTDDWVMRAVAFGGESIEIRGGSIYINSEKLETAPFRNFNYTSIGNFGVEGDPFLVPEDSIFVLGDYSNNSRDSRDWGVVPEENVIGKAFKRYWPPNRVGTLEYSFE